MPFRQSSTPSSRASCRFHPRRSPLALAASSKTALASRAAAGDLNAARTVIKQETRAAREITLAAKQQALPARRYGCIAADPEWQFEVWSRATGLDRSADNHYPTSCLQVIADRDVPSIAAADCVLFLWATVPMLPHALVVMGAWGFDYKTHFAWAKDRVGTGYWNRNKHEILLLGTRGKVPCPAPGTQWDSLISAPLGGHSEKPECFLELIEAYFPHLPKIELNRRGPPRPGWDAWGNEAAAASDAAVNAASAIPVSSEPPETAPADDQPRARPFEDDGLEIPQFLRRAAPDLHEVKP